jgi:hypothetical protein
MSPDAKPMTQMVDTLSEKGSKHDVESSGADYSGAVAKTDPKEIALVKKLDWRIMPLLWCMYFLNYVSMKCL